LSKDQDDLGGLKEMLNKFYTHVEQRLKDHSVLGLPVDIT
jgi:hypothetical protein